MRHGTPRPCQERGASPPHVCGGRPGGDGRGTRPCQLPPPPLPPSRSPGPRGRQSQLLASRLGPLGDSQLIGDDSGSHLVWGAEISAHGEDTDHPSEQMAGRLRASVSGAVYILK